MSTIINQTELLLDKVLVDWVSKVFIDGKLTEIYNTFHEPDHG